MNNQEFLFLFDAILQNANERPYRQRRFLCQALRHGHINMATAMPLREKHHIGGSLNDLNEACIAYLSTLMPDPDDQLDRQQTPEPPGEFEQDPMNPCGALDPRF